MSKRSVCTVILIALLCAPLAVRAADAAEGAQAISGVEVHYARIGDWTVYLDDTARPEADMRILGEKDGAEPVELAADVTNLIPAGDSFVFYGSAADGKQRWQLMSPGEPERRILPISWAESVIGADDSHVWYYAMGDGANRVIYRVGKDGKGKKRLGTLQGTVIARMDDGQILTCFYARDQVRLWSNGKYTMLFEAPEVHIQAVYTDGRHILMQTQDAFGLLQDGAFVPLFSRSVCAIAIARDQIVLASYSGPDLFASDECIVHLVDFTKPGIARLGAVAAAPNIGFRVGSDAVAILSGGAITRFAYPESFEPFEAADAAG